MEYAWLRNGDASNGEPSQRIETDARFIGDAYPNAGGALRQILYGAAEGR